LPSALGVGQYFLNFWETISYSDLNASHYLYISVTSCRESFCCFLPVPVFTRHLSIRSGSPVLHRISNVFTDIVTYIAPYVIPVCAELHCAVVLYVFGQLATLPVMSPVTMSRTPAGIQAQFSCMLQDVSCKQTDVTEAGISISHDFHPKERQVRKRLIEAARPYRQL